MKDWQTRQVFKKWIFFPTILRRFKTCLSKLYLSTVCTGTKVSLKCETDLLLYPNGHITCSLRTHVYMLLHVSADK